MITNFLEMLETQEVINAVEGLIISLIVSLLIAFVGFLLKAIAIFIMAKKQGLKNKWFAFVPFLNYVLLGKLIGPIRIFRVKMKNAGLFLAIVSFSLEVVYILLNLGYYKAVLETIFPISISVSTEFARAWFAGEGVLYIFVHIIGYILNIAEIFISISLIFAIFRKYAPEKMFLYGLISVFIDFFFGIALLLVANRTPVDYESYIRKMREQQMNNYNAYNGYNGYQNPYGYRKPQEPKEEPFPEFSNKESEEIKDKSNDEFFN